MMHYQEPLPKYMCIINMLSVYRRDVLHPFTFISFGISLYPLNFCIRDIKTHSIICIQMAESNCRQCCTLIMIEFWKIDSNQSTEGKLANQSEETLTSSINIPNPKKLRFVLRNWYENIFYIFLLLHVKSQINIPFVNMFRKIEKIRRHTLLTYINKMGRRKKKIPKNDEPDITFTNNIIFRLKRKI